MNRRRLLLQLSVIVLLPTAAAARVWADDARVQVEGQSFDSSADVFGTALRLNGTGLRAVAWFKGFVAGLYLSEGATSAAQALAAPGPKRVQLRLLHEVPAVELTKAVRKGVNKNSTLQEQQALQRRLDQFDTQFAALKTLRTGDVIDLDLDPGRGLQLRLNGKPLGAMIAGDDFYAGVLRSFVGDKPYDEKLKAGLLGRPA